MSFVSLIDLLNDIATYSISAKEWEGYNISEHEKNLWNFASAAHALYAKLNNNPTSRPQWQKMRSTGGEAFNDDTQHDEGMNILLWLSEIHIRESDEKNKDLNEIDKSELSQKEKDAQAFKMGREIGFKSAEIKQFLNSLGLKVDASIKSFNSEILIRRIVWGTDKKPKKAGDFIELLVDAITPKERESEGVIISNVHKVSATGVESELSSSEDCRIFEKLVGYPEKSNWYEQGLSPETWDKLVADFEKNKKLKANKSLGVDWTIKPVYKDWGAFYTAVRLKDGKDFRTQLRSDIEQGRIKALEARGLAAKTLAGNTVLTFDEAQKFAGEMYEIVLEGEAEYVPSVEDETQSSKEQQKKLPLMRQQVEAIVEALSELGYEPKAYPAGGGGNAGARSQVREKIAKNAIFRNDSSFDNAWQQAIKLGDIKPSEE